MIPRFPDPEINQPKPDMPSGIERRREIRRRRTRQEKVQKLVARYKAKTMEPGEVIRKLRAITPGADEIIKRESIKS